MSHSAHIADARPQTEAAPHNTHHLTADTNMVLCTEVADVQALPWTEALVPGTLVAFCSCNPYSDFSKLL